MIEVNREALRSQLKWALQALAIEPAEQLAQVPDGCDKLGELAEDLEVWFLSARSHLELSEDQIAKIEALDQLLARMSRGGPDYTPELWDDDALSESPLWASARTLAKAALDELGWPVEVPRADRRFS